MSTNGRITPNITTGATILTSCPKGRGFSRLALTDFIVKLENSSTEFSELINNLTTPGWIRSSPKFGLITPYRLTIRNSARLFHYVLFNMGDLHFVLPALNLSTLNAGILIMMQQVRLMMFSLNMVDYSMSFLLLIFFCWTSRGHSEPFLLFDFLCGTLPSCLKVLGWGGVVAHEILMSAQGPLVFGLFVFWAKGLGPGLDNTIRVTCFIKT